MAIPQPDPRETSGRKHASDLIAQAFHSLQHTAHSFKQLYYLLGAFTAIAATGLFAFGVITWILSKNVARMCG